MQHQDIALTRLHNLCVNGGGQNSGTELVRHLGAVQAQDYPMACLALGIRLPGITLHEIEKAVEDTLLVRTHVMRPTWHLVPAADVRWMVAFSADRVRVAMRARDRELELDSKLIAKANDLLASALAGGCSLGREVIARLLQAHGIRTDDNRLSHILMRAEQDLVIGSGKHERGKPTYRLLDACLPAQRMWTGDEAAAELVRRYFTSHGPAQADDFAWWSGLPLTAARRALASVSGELESFRLDEKTYWMGKETMAKHDAATVHLLPAFDEFLVGYRDRSAVIPAAYSPKAIFTNGIFRPVVVAGGQVAGIWSRTVIKGKVMLAVTLFSACTAETEGAIIKAAASYGIFLQKEIEVFINGQNKVIDVGQADITGT